MTPLSESRLAWIGLSILFAWLSTAAIYALWLQPFIDQWLFDALQPAGNACSSPSGDASLCEQFLTQHARWTKTIRLLFIGLGFPTLSATLCWLLLRQRRFRYWRTSLLLCAISGIPFLAFASAYPTAADTPLYQWIAGCAGIFIGSRLSLRSRV